jgi:hypothetical protein
MLVSQLIKDLQGLDPDKIIMTQVIAQDGTVWNCWFEINDIARASIVQLKVWHPELKTLPKS